jgi:hypothetical protein
MGTAQTPVGDINRKPSPLRIQPDVNPCVTGNMIVLL